MAKQAFDSLMTITTPVDVDATHLVVRAECFPSLIPLDRLRERYTAQQILHDDPLIVRVADNSYVVVFPFGAVVFWGCDEPVCAQVIHAIQSLPDMAPVNREVQDRVVVALGQSEDRVGFREIALQALTLQHIKIISETFAQSVALKLSELTVAATLKTTTPIVHGLETHGSLRSSTKGIIRTVGFALGVRERILAKLGLFDAPVETWQSERLARLHASLYDYFDIAKRLDSLKEKITFLSDLNALLLNLLQTRTSHRLEWIVILLIVIEVILSLTSHFLHEGK